MESAIPRMRLGFSFEVSACPVREVHRKALTAEHDAFPSTDPAYIETDVLGERDKVANVYGELFARAELFAALLMSPRRLVVRALSDAAAGRSTGIREPGARAATSNRHEAVDRVRGRASTAFLGFGGGSVVGAREQQRRPS